MQKTKKIKKVDPEAKKFYQVYVTLQRGRKGWEQKRCLRHLQDLAPEVYGHLHMDTPRKWKDADSIGLKGRLSHLLAGSLIRFTEIVHKATSKDAFGRPVIQTLLRAEAKAMGIDYNCGDSWTCDFLKNLNYGSKDSGKLVQEVLPESEYEDARLNLQGKIHWTCKKHNIPYSRVMYIDQTTLMIPVDAIFMSR